MHLLLPRRLLAVVFTALLGVVALSSIGAGPASAAGLVPARMVAHDSRSTMTITDDESWPISDEIQTFSLANEPDMKVWSGSAPAYSKFSRCAGNEVKIVVNLKTVHMWDDSVQVTAQALLFEGQACNTSDLDGWSAERIVYIPRGRNAQISLPVQNTEEGGDSAKVNLSLTNYSILY